MSKILITGVAGFIGYHTAKLLLYQGHEVVGLDNMNNYTDTNMQIFRSEELKKYPNFLFYCIDIQDINSLNDFFSLHRFDAVIHLAAKVGVRESVNSPHNYFNINLQGTLNILDMMKKYQVNKLVFASTSSVYAGLEVPFYENAVTESPASPYGISKRAAEMLCYNYHTMYGIDVSIVRYFTVYGPGGRPDMSYFRFIKWIDEDKPVIINGDGTQFRDFSYVEDIAEGTSKALKNIGYEVFNLGGGNGTYSLNYMIELIEDYLQKKAQVVHRPFLVEDMKATWANIDKAKNMLGWQPQTNFKTGIKKCIDWYLENKTWIKEMNM
ncbi:MAG: GDP-mannose 4,6-dehydratase [Thermoflexibacter sp.]|jgi:nucleoside-diphosphate-sugar epimerase|nr:GDP-mannose 4,6-dehydratase [Thermoflexibacter sp.]